MKIDLLSHKLKVTQNKVEFISQRTEDLLLHPELLSQILEELSIALEELQVQHEELLANRQELESERQFYQDLFESVPEGYLVTDIKGIIQNANQAAANMFNMRPAFLIGKPLIVFVADRDRKFFISKINLLAQLQQPEKWELNLQPRKAEEFPAKINISIINDKEENSPSGLRWLIRNIAEEKKTEAQMRHDILHDSLTQLPNQILLVDRLEHSLLCYQRDQNQLFALLFIDLDDFKRINDNFGHLCGDKLLIEIANRFLSCIQETDTLVRLYGDEFIILLQNIRSLEVATHCADRLLEALSTPIAFDCHEEIIKASIGIAMSDPIYQDPEQIIRDADSAMYQSKKNKNVAYTVWIT